ncbi:MAG: hypothetical protein HYX53_16235 [Chloroflexi bacterium]|nr:hypothetical protein [Chloroflexota bacterium]
MTEPVLVRRPVPEKEPEDTSGRRGCILLGALLGVAVGAVFALFGLPPIIHYYFGSANIEVGETYRGDGKNIRVESAGRREVGVVPKVGSATGTGQAWFVTLSLNPTRPWDTTYDNFELELEDGTRIGALPAGSDAVAPLAFRAANPVSLVLQFGVAEAEQSPAKSLRTKDPSVRFDIGLLSDGGTGTTYSVGDKLIRVDGVRTYLAGRNGATPYVSVDLSVRSETAWTPKQDVFQLLLSDGSRITAEPPTEKVPVTFAQFEPGRERKFALLFVRSNTTAEPAMLQLASPAASLPLPPAIAGP